MLLNKQINALHQVILTHQLEPADFRLSGTAGSFTIELKDSLFRFALTKAEAGFGLDTTPATASFADYAGIPHDQQTAGYTWASILEMFGKWARLLAEDAVTPNLWARSYEQNQVEDYAFESEDDTFSVLEMMTLKNQLNHWQHELTSSSTLPEAAIDKLTAIAQEASERADTSTKSGFNSWFIQTTVATLTGLALPPAQVQEVTKLMQSVLGGLFLH